MYQILKKKTLNRTKKKENIIGDYDIYLMFVYCSKNYVLENVLFMMIEHQDF